MFAFVPKIKKINLNKIKKKNVKKLNKNKTDRNQNKFVYHDHFRTFLQAFLLRKYRSFWLI